MGKAEEEQREEMLLVFQMIVRLVAQRRYMDLGVCAQMCKDALERAKEVMEED